jgi:hypothetical protein
MKTELTSLAEALKSLTKYPDREIIDYWRTIQGTPVGFHGDPKSGAGIPIAGPPVLTGGSASGNPLLAPLLKKYPAKTFIGDAIRKPNFPLSAINFIENFVGKDEDAIKARFAEMENRILEFGQYGESIKRAGTERYEAGVRFAGKVIVNDAGDKVYVYDVLSSNNPIDFSDSENKFVVRDAYSKNKEINDYVDDLNKRGMGHVRPVEGLKIKDLDKNYYSGIYVQMTESPEYLADKESKLWGPAMMLDSHFGDPSGNSSILYRVMMLEGVAGTLTSDDYGSKLGAESMKGKEGLDAYLKKSRNTDYEKCKQFIGDLYVMNQIMMTARGRKSQKVTRGMGQKLAGLIEQSSSVKVVAELEKKGVSMRFINRPVSGFASGGTSKFKGWTVNVDIPTEAILSSTWGANIQGNQFPEEKEVLVIGASSLAFAPSQITYVSGKKVWSSSQIAAKVASGQGYMIS